MLGLIQTIQLYLQSYIHLMKWLSVLWYFRGIFYPMSNLIFSDSDFYILQDLKKPLRYTKNMLKFNVPVVNGHKLR